MSENRFFLWTKIVIKIKTRDKIKCSQNILRGGGNFHGGKLTLENAPLSSERDDKKLIKAKILHTPRKNAS